MKLTACFFLNGNFLNMATNNSKQETMKPKNNNTINTPTVTTAVANHDWLLLWLFYHFNILPFFVAIDYFIRNSS